MVIHNLIDNAGTYLKTLLLCLSCNKVQTRTASQKKKHTRNIVFHNAFRTNCSVTDKHEEMLEGKHFKPSALRGMLLLHNMIAHRCDRQKLFRSGNHQRLHHRVF